MKKILILIFDFDVPHNAVSFCIHLAKKYCSKVNAVFVGSMQNDEIDVEKQKRLENLQIELFEQTCKDANINFNVLHLKESYFDMIIDETAFADLLICKGDLDINYFSMESFIVSSHCPVLLVPENVTLFEQIIFTYDGNSSSIHAMKHFSYLFSWVSNKKIYLVSVLPSNILQMEHDALVREWMLLHFENVEFVVLKGDVKSELPHFINQNKNCLVVMGAFGRSSLSRLFKESLAHFILSETQAPVFISHT